MSGDTNLPALEGSEGSTNPSALEAQKRWYRYVDTETGLVHETHLCHCGGASHDGIPCEVAELIDDRKYYRKYRAMIQQGQMPYLLACAQYVRDRAGKRIPVPSHYFAAITSKARWAETRAGIILRRRHERYVLKDSGPVRDLSAERRFRAKVKWDDHPEVCSVWTAARDRNGYGVFKADGKTVMAHRWWYEHQHGQIPAGKQIDHGCTNRACVKHLRLMDPGKNAGRRENPRPDEVQEKAALTRRLQGVRAGVLMCYRPGCPDDVEWILTGSDIQVNVCAQHRSRLTAPDGSRWVPVDPESQEPVSRRVRS